MKIFPMNQIYARQIMAWQYPPHYDFYTMTPSIDLLNELLRDDYYAVVDSETSPTLLGFYAFGSACRIATEDPAIYARDAVDFGLGMSPLAMGQGNGLAFVKNGMAFAREKYSHSILRLTVASFNERAILVYQRAGFAQTGSLTSAQGVIFNVMEINLH